MEQLKRSTKVTFTILEGEDILREGQETARHLWNFTRHCAVSFNYRLRQQRGHWPWADYRHLMPPYPGKFAMQKELKDYWAAQNLSDRCFSKTVDEFDIAMRSWFSNLKNNPKARPPRYADIPRQLTFEVGRNAKPVGEWTYRLTVLGKHIKERYAVVKIRLQPGIKMKQIKLIRVQPDLTGTVVYYQEQQNRAGEAMAAVDLGIINIATLAFSSGESILVSGKGILSSDQYYHKRASQCKPSGWHKGMSQEKRSKREVAYRRKAGNIRRLAVHNLTRFIISECLKRQVGTIVIGDLKGIRQDKDHGKRGNQSLHAWPFAEIVRQLEYKAEEVNIEVIKVSERETSKRCHICGEVGVRNPRGLLKCNRCQAVMNSDVNGAFGILNKVSPSRICVGVGAVLPGSPSPGIAATNGQGRGIGKAQFSQIHPTFTAKFDLRNWSIAQDR